MYRLEVMAHARMILTPNSSQYIPVIACKHCRQTLSSTVSVHLRPPRAETEKTPVDSGNSNNLFNFPTAMDGKIAALAVPALGTELIDPLLSACDTAFVGRLGVEPLAGVALASSVFTISSLVRTILHGLTTTIQQN